MLYAVLSAVSTVIPTVTLAPTATATVAPTVMPTAVATIMPTATIVPVIDSISGWAKADVVIALFGVIATLFLGYAALRSSNTANRIAQQQLKREEDMRSFEHKIAAFDKVSEIYDFQTHALSDEKFTWFESHEKYLTRINSLQSKAMFLFDEKTYRLIYAELEGFKKYLNSTEHDDVNALKKEIKQYDSSLTDENIMAGYEGYDDPSAHAIYLLNMAMPYRIDNIIARFKLNL